MYRCNICNKAIALSKKTLRNKKFCPYCGSNIHNDDYNIKKTSYWKLNCFISRRINHKDVDTYIYQCRHCGYETSNPLKICKKCHYRMIDN